MLEEPERMPDLPGGQTGSRVSEGGPQRTLALQMDEPRASE